MPSEEPIAEISAVTASRTCPAWLSLRPTSSGRSTARHVTRAPAHPGHAVSACGTGKTLTALRTAEALEVRHLLIAVPSLTSSRSGPGQPATTDAENR